MQARLRTVHNVFRRNYRIKPGIGLTADERDERIQRYLEAELARVQAKMKQEEQETEKLFRTKTKSGGKDMFENHLVYLWEKFVKDSDKKRLASYGIRSIDDLYGVYDQARQIISSPNHPGIESLDEKLQYAYHMYDTLPQQVHDSQREKPTPKPTSAFLSSRYTTWM